MSTVFNAAMIGVMALMVSSGCGATQQAGAAPAGPPSSAAVDDVARPPASVGGAPECVDDKDQPVECLSDSDCCSGFVCGKDPALSLRVRYCIYGG
jgi:ion channel inhibitory toxin